MPTKNKEIKEVNSEQNDRQEKINALQEQINALQEEQQAEELQTEMPNRIARLEKAVLSHQQVIKKISRDVKQLTENFETLIKAG